MSDDPAWVIQRLRTLRNEPSGDAQDEFNQLAAKRATTEALLDTVAQAEERAFEAEAIIDERDDRLALVDKIAEMIGLPHDQELDITAFQLWFADAVKDTSPAP